MKPEELSSRPGQLYGALDAALERALRPPAPPADFRMRLSAARAHAAEPEDAESVRMRLEHERRDGLAELEAGYLRLRRHALGTLICGAFAAGTGLRLLLPWLKAVLGSDATLVVALLGGAAALAIAGAPQLGGSALARPLQRLWES